jgi:hypothetical protein
MPFLSAGTSYVVADSLKKRWSRRVLGLNGGADREGLLKGFHVDYQSVHTILE